VTVRKPQNIDIVFSLFNLEVTQTILFRHCRSQWEVIEGGFNFRTGTIGSEAMFVLRNVTLLSKAFVVSTPTFVIIFATNDLGG